MHQFKDRDAFVKTQLMGSPTINGREGPAQGPETDPPTYPTGSTRLKETEKPAQPVCTAERSVASLTGGNVGISPVVKMGLNEFLCLECGLAVTTSFVSSAA